MKYAMMCNIIIIANILHHWLYSIMMLYTCTAVLIVLLYTILRQYGAIFQCCVTYHIHEHLATVLSLVSVM